MPLYLYRATYTAESLAAQIRAPQNRIEAVTPLYESVGARVLAAGHPFGEDDVLVVFEAPDDATAASLALTVGAGGAVSSAATTRLLTGDEWASSLQQAQSVSSQYQPAR